MKDFLDFWSTVDLNKAFDLGNSYKTNVLLWYSHLESGYIVYVTADDIGMTLGDSTQVITQQLCSERNHIKISELGESLMLMNKL